MKTHLVVTAMQTDMMGLWYPLSQLVVLRVFYSCAGRNREARSEGKGGIVNDRGNPWVRGTRGDGKLGGNLPDIFNGDRAMVDQFMNQFNLYHITNLDAEQMINPMKRMALFLGFIKGPNIKDWVKRWTNWTIDQFTTGRATNDKYYWNKVFRCYDSDGKDP
jgi:hypothetical protein